MHEALLSSVTVVDDEPFIQDILSRAARSWHYQCQTADCAEKALELLEKQLTPVVVTDLRMPGLGGVWLWTLVCPFVGAATGQEGLALAERDAPDLVILDVKMPGMDGLELLRALKRQRPILGDQFDQDAEGHHLSLVVPHLELTDVAELNYANAEMRRSMIADMKLIDCCSQNAIG
jgi:CheY-like chemotaxis protein